jgi:hypothetical protein
MAIARYVADADTTITNAFEADLKTRGTGSNMGYADSIEIFSIYGQTSGSAGQSQELSRALMRFPITSIVSDRAAGTIPASGSVSFYLRVHNATHPFTLPQDFSLTVTPVSRSWTEGTGLDMDEYKDLGTANWLRATDSVDWTSIGGDYISIDPGSTYTIAFEQGYEDIELDVTRIVEQWVDGTHDNYGFGIHLVATDEAYFSSSTGADTSVLIDNPTGAQQSYYTKKFFARSTEFFFKRPVIEARWDSRVSDDRENFYYSSSAAPAEDNLNKLYLYNYVRGRLVNIPVIDDGNTLMVSLFSGSTFPTGSKLTLYDGNLNTTASWVSRGIYSAELAITAALSTEQPKGLTVLYDVWHNQSSGGPHTLGTSQYFTGSIYPELMPTYDSAPTFQRITSCRNLKKSYSTADTARFRFFVRDRNWNPTIYVKANANNPTDIITSASYNVRRVIDNYNAVPYGTGSEYSTYLSYDKKGNYFDLDMSLLEAGYMYTINLSYYNDSIGAWQEQPQTFKFRVD